MTPAHRRYLATEIAVAVVINALLSLIFVVAVFGGRTEIPLWGRHGLLIDAVPQGFMVALMSCMVPSVLTRRRRATGVIGSLPSAFLLPGSLLVRSLLIAAAAAAVSWALQAALLPPIALRWSFAAVLGFKCGYGALLGAAVATLAVRTALAE